jgi:NAD(P)-dependent dehydrogenase (short-subunit alcohol dehydrogenase family)
MMTKPVVLITGAAGGLGSALAAEFARKGVELMLLDKDSRGLDRVSDQLVNDGLPEPALCPLDLACAGPEAYLELASILEKEFGGLDHIVHCAAHFSGLAPMDQIAPGEWMTAIQVNLTAAWAMTVACLPQLRRSSAASVTFLSDEEERSEAPYWGAYGVAKAAVSSLARILQQELEPAGVEVRSHNPGPMRTGLRATAYLGEDPATQPHPAAAAAALARIVLQT